MKNLRDSLPQLYAVLKFERSGLIIDTRYKNKSRIDLIEFSTDGRFKVSGSVGQMDKDNKSYHFVSKKFECCE